MANGSTVEKPTFSGDPYLDPSNVHARDDGTVVAYGPHGQEFELTDLQRAIVTCIAVGLIPEYRQQQATWDEANRSGEVHHP